MTTNDFEVYWIIGDEKITSFAEMRGRVLNGEIAIEVSAEVQLRANERREQIAAREAELAEQSSREALRQEHEDSPGGKAEAARRTALEHPGGIVSGVMNPLAELDAFMPDKTSLL